MVDGIGRSGAGKAAIDAALKAMQARARSLGSTQGGPSSGALDRVGGLDAARASAGSADASSFTEALKEGLGAVEGQVDRTNQVHIDVLEGRLDLHEVAAQIKESEITFQFALQVRNKLMDAYREVMRMSV